MLVARILSCWSGLAVLLVGVTRFGWSNLAVAGLESVLLVLVVQVALLVVSVVGYVSGSLVWWSGLLSCWIVSLLDWWCCWFCGLPGLPLVFEILRIICLLGHGHGSGAMLGITKPWLVFASKNAFTTPRF